MSGAAHMRNQYGAEEVLWNLEDLYRAPDSKEFNDDITWCDTEAHMIAAEYRGTIGRLAPERLLRLIIQIERLEERLAKLGTYTFLRFTTQIDNEAAGAVHQKIHELANRCGTHIIFFELEWNMRTEEQALELLNDPWLSRYRHYLESLRRYRPHQLQETEERLLLELNSVGRSSWNTLFDKVIANLRFGADGRTEEEVLSDLHNHERTVREQAADDLTAGLKSQAHILTHIFNSLATEKMTTDRLRHYPLWISSMNLNNQVDDDTVDTLINAVTSRHDIVNRYYRLKKSLLGLDTLYDYDRYAPLPDLPSVRIDWQQCRTIVLDAFAGFSGQLKEIAQQFFDKNWIHAPVSAGKRGGAFAHPCIPGHHPYVMVNYTGTLRDVATVAHELGHGVHQVLAARNGFFNSDTPLVLAETASVFAELLVFKAQLEFLDTPRERRAYICQKLESIFATVFRQVAMNRFEQRMHEGRRCQGELGSDELSMYWLETQQEMFGDSVTLRDGYKLWWSYIPHFLSSPGYVYSYAFGELLVLALYNIYLQEGALFIDKYVDLLAAGGSARPEDLLKPFGVALHDPSFWHQGLSVIDAMLEEVEQLSHL